MPVPLSNPAKSSVLGQFTDEALDAAKSVATDTAKGVTSVTNPKKILESILGQTNNTSQNENASIENLSGSQQPIADPVQTLKQQQNLIAKRQAEDQAKSQALLRLHRQRLQEEESYFAQSQQKQQIEVQQEQQAEKQKQQEEVVQLSHEKQKEDVLGSMIKQYEGSKEQKAWGAG